eukprot:1883-Eustigmatos_ZCMA.PRE.1
MLPSEGGSNVRYACEAYWTGNIHANEPKSSRMQDPSVEAGFVSLSADPFNETCSQHGIQLRCIVS